MGNHRQNMFSVPVIHNVLCGPDVFSVRAFRAEDGYEFDFSLFDKCVETFLAEDPRGIIVGGHLSLFGTSGRKLDDQGNLSLRFPTIYIWDRATGRRTETLESMDVDRSGYRHFLRSLMPVLQKHLEEKGSLDQFYICVHDETFPRLPNRGCGLLSSSEKLAPGLKFLDANRNTIQGGSIDMWFPLPNQFEGYRDFYKEKQETGEEVGFYTCITPAGYNMNRFVSLPLIKTRLLHWYNYKFGLTGYLHWGYNAKFPPYDVEKVSMDGDANLVYKGKVGFPFPQ